MDGLPVTVRLLDPPLHEFLPDSKDLAAKVAEAEARGENAGELVRQLRIAERLEEVNPMLGLRGSALEYCGRRSTGCRRGPSLPPLER